MTLFLRGVLGVVICLIAVTARGDDGSLVEFRGETMGTTYSVKVFDPPDWGEEIGLEIDLELRRVNDQMSTYLASSEISRFNASDSTDWFAVSEETALVVEAAQEIAEATDGAFDVTVSPLVDAWSFGPGPRTNRVPDEESLEALRRIVGYRHLSVRLDPPALRKAIPELRVDLSAIAKGHGVDRVVGRLMRAGAENVFVEIGGEVRAIGDKAGVPWKVGIQRPDAVADSVLVAYPLVNCAVATSGDYRNRFEIDGKFYSHTIDPRTGAPTTFGTASATVIADDCMRADAWATAITALGPDAGLALARERGIDLLLISRDDRREFQIEGSGLLAEIAQEARESLVAEQVDSVEGNVDGDAAASFLTTLMPVLLITMVAFGLLLAVMAIGVLFGRRSISGSCGGLSARGGDGSNCSMCGNSTEGCRDLQKRLAESGVTSGEDDDFGSR